MTARMGKRVKLYDYQARCVEAVAQHHRSGKARVLVVSPVGSGKGTMAAHMLRETLAAREARALFVVHSRDIVEDMARRLEAAGVEGVGVVLGGRPRTPGARVQVCSVQALARAKPWPVDLVIVDEAHHYPRTSDWAAVARRFKARRVVGFTATPERRDGSPLGGRGGFQAMVVAAQYSELLARKPPVIVPCRVMIPERPVGKRGRALTPDQAYLQYGGGRSAFIFCATAGEVPTVTRRLVKAGVAARAVLDSTPKPEREQALADLRAGRVACVVNFETMTEGVDVPRVSCVVLGRRVTHVGKYIQITGRALRAFPGKSEALLLDLTGAFARPGFENPTADREFALTGEEPIKRPLLQGEGGIWEVRAPTRAAPSERGVGLVEVSAEAMRAHGVVRLDANAIDWSRSNADIACDVGVSRTPIALIRKRSGILQPRRYDYDDPAWRALDWSKSNLALAHEVAADPATIRRIRKHIGIRPTRALRRYDRNDPLWRRMDWKKSDRELARVTGVPVGGISRMRGLLGIKHHKHGGGYVDYDDPKWKALDWTKCDHNLAATTGSGIKTIAKIRCHLGKPPARFKNDYDDPKWKALDWERTNASLASQTGVSAGTIAKIRRHLGK